MATLKIEERKKGAIKFVNKWKGRGREDEEYTDFWYDLLNMVYGVENPWECFKKQGKVVIEGQHKRMDLTRKNLKISNLKIDFPKVSNIVIFNLI